MPALQQHTRLDRATYVRGLPILWRVIVRSLAFLHMYVLTCACLCLFYGSEIYVGCVVTSLAFLAGYNLLPSLAIHNFSVVCFL